MSFNDLKGKRILNQSKYIPPRDLTCLVTPHLKMIPNKYDHTNIRKLELLITTIENGKPKLLNQDENTRFSCSTFI